MFENLSCRGGLNLCVPPLWRQRWHQRSEISPHLPKQHSRHAFLDQGLSLRCMTTLDLLSGLQRRKLLRPEPARRSCCCVFLRTRCVRQQHWQRPKPLWPRGSSAPNLSRKRTGKAGHPGRRTNLKWNHSKIKWTYWMTVGKKVLNPPWRSSCDGAKVHNLIMGQHARTLS